MLGHLIFSSLYRTILIFILLYGTIANLAAQEMQPSIEKQYQINKIQFNGNRAVDNDALNEVILTKETPGAVSQFFYRTLGDKIGSKPEYFDAAIFAEDQLRLIEYYRGNGFFNPSITTNSVIDSSDNRIDLFFNIEEKKRSYIDSILYVGIDTLPPDISSKILLDPMIVKGAPYLSSNASSEIARMLDYLWNSGYPAAKYDSEKSGAFKFTSTDNFYIKFVFISGKRYKFGDISVHVDPPRKDVTDELSIRQLDFTPGEVFSREKVISSEGSLNRLGLFESARVDYPAVSDTTTTNIIPVDIYVRPLNRNELSPELLVSDEGGFFNLGAGVGYTNRNFFGDARIFTAHTRIRTQDIHRWNFGNVFHGKGLRDISVKGTIELQFHIIQPYFFTRTLSGSWTSTISAEKQELIILSILRNNIGLSKQFATYTYGFFDWTLERVSPEIIQDTLRAQSILSTLRQEDQRQFNSILTFTLQRDKTNDVFSPSAGFFNSISLEESGILPKILPGIRSGLPFTQYYKATLLGRWYQDLTRRRFNILAWKLKSGYQNKYGESKYSSVQIPLNRRYFAGGSGSVRGWRARELGAMPAELIQFGGNFIFEGSVEMRVDHFQGFGKLWFLRLENLRGVYFLDFGNTWSDIVDFKPKQIAVAAGIGLRYETFFGPFRIDYGFRVYDPAAEAGKQTVFQKIFFRETLKNAVFNFGIGHAF